MSEYLPQSADDETLRRHINDLSSTALFHSDPAEREVAQAARAPYFMAHYDWLTNQTSELVKTATDKNLHVVSLTDMADAKEHFSTHNGHPETAKLDIASLGLPQLPYKNNSHPEIPIVLVAEGGATVKTITLVTRTPEGDLKRYFLEDTGKTNTADPGDRAMWVQPGHAVLSHSYYNPTVARATRKEGYALEQLCFDNQSDDASSPGIIIRGKPNRVEALTQSEDPLPVYYSRYLAPIGGVVAAVGITLSPSNVEMPEFNRPIAAADEIVVTDLTKLYAKTNERLQAENHFTERTLARGHKAVSAFLAGDIEKLQQQVAENGYETNWIDPTLLERLEQADSPESVEQITAEALAETPFTFSILQDSDESHPLSHFYHHTPSKNLAAARKQAVNLVQLLNRFDRTFIQNCNPVDVTIVSDTKPLFEEEGLGGYFDRPYETEHTPTPESNVLRRDSIVVVEDQDAMEHEMTHKLAIGDGVLLANLMQSLNPSGWQYSEEYNPNYTTTHKKENVTGNSYGSKNPEEDGAVLGEELLKAAPKIRFEESALSEKQVAFLLKMEERSPGFMAALFLRSSFEQQYSLYLESLETTPAEAIAPWLVVGGGLFAAAAAANVGLNMRRRSYASRYGVQL